MPRNGSGEYTLPYNWNDDKANGIKMLASRMQGQDQDIADALTGSLASDGQTSLTGNLDYNGNRAIDLGDGQNTQDATTIGQTQTGELQYYGLSSTIPLGTPGKDYQVSANPTLNEYVDGLNFSFLAHIDCIADPILRVDTEAQLNIAKDDGEGGYTNCSANDILQDHIYECVYNEIIGVDKLLIKNPTSSNQTIGNLNVKGKFSTVSGATKTIVSGAITADSSNFLIDTEGGASSDDLITINGGVDGMFITIGIVADGRNTIIKNNTDNIYNPSGADIALDVTSDKVQLFYSTSLSKWIVTQAKSLMPVMVVEDQKSSGTVGGSNGSSLGSGATITRDLNTVVKNTIPGASLSGNQIILPAGTYYIDATSSSYASNGCKIYFANITDNNNALIGLNYFCNTTDGYTNPSAKGIISIDSQKTFELKQYSRSPDGGTSGLGLPLSIGQPEIYSQVYIEKRA